ncbi:MAG: DNA-3-methyladenine glycosylase I [Pseudomonadota bacterium]
MEGGAVAQDDGGALLVGADGLARCPWCGQDPEYIRYHDEEWGRPVGDDQRLFEKICLEGFQSGLSWLTILRKRTNFRSAFADFDIERVARFGEADVARLLADAGIVRHRGKIEAAIGNAKAALKLREAEGSLAGFIWRFEETPAPAPRRLSDVPTQTAASKALAKELKARGWRFFGPTTAYAFLQSMGVVNDHLEGCAFRSLCEAERAAFQRP